MAKSFGKDDLLWIESATPGTYNAPKGQGDLKMSRSRDKVDLSDKTSSGYKLSGYALADLTLTVDIQPDLPDANGFTRLETAAKQAVAAPINVQIRRNGLTASATTDVLFQASMYPTITDQSSPTSGVRTTSFEFGLAAAPSVDTISLS